MWGRRGRCWRLGRTWTWSQSRGWVAVWAGRLGLAAHTAAQPPHSPETAAMLAARYGMAEVAAAIADAAAAREAAAAEEAARLEAEAASGKKK